MEEQKFRIARTKKIMFIFEAYMLEILRYFLLPFSALYGFAIWLRNKAYDCGFLKSQGFDLPVIVIGNLAVGGAGKSPMTEYLVRLLQNKAKIATLSRGYGRKTRGFLEVNKNDDALKVGDEPLQFKQKFPAITVAVCEKRVVGVEKLQADHDLVILDDAYQHRALKPGLSILLLEYRSLLKPKFLLPAGDFRDTFDQRNRADIIVVSKSPQELTEQEKKSILKRVRVSTDKPVLFSYLKYGLPYRLEEEIEIVEKEEIDTTSTLLLVTGIADPKPLLDYLKTQVTNVISLSYADHHHFTASDIKKISAKFDSIQEPNKLIITTEKDAQRLRSGELSGLIQSLPIVVLPVEAAFNEASERVLSENIFNYLSAYKKTGISQTH